MSSHIIDFDVSKLPMMTIYDWHTGLIRLASG